ncbi:PQQ-binding-like beta-propeller repeat protein [Amphibacillus jilinensis]|uniref:outer membrane protein assembly factor BamB family protein n=1 Tax=Amphibacillus jilinensis TaxID=1216008 RepID=UPI0002E0987D|nr:PQQ-binding-like beta-propeller repeat protein [Amphibacillus jilinensis]
MNKNLKVLGLVLTILTVLAACDDQSVNKTEYKDDSGGDLGSIPEDIGTFDVNEGIGGFATGGYDENAIHPTQVGWTRQSRFEGVDEPEIKQTFELPGRIHSLSEKSEPIVDADGNFYFKVNESDEETGSYEGEIDGYYAMNREGEILWERTRYHQEYDVIPGNSAILSPSLDTNNRLIGMLEDSKVAGLDKETGEMDFVYELESNLANHEPWPQVIDSEGVTYLTHDGQIIAINPDGSVKWEYGDEDKPDISNPAISEDRLFVKSRSGIMALDLNGDVLWEEGLDRVMGNDQSNVLIADDGSLYFAHGDRLMSFSPDGDLIWDVEVDEDEDQTTYFSGYNGLALSGDGLIIGLFLPNLYAFDLDGNEVWQADAERSFGGIVVDSNGDSYFASQSRVYSFDSSGERKWTLDLPLSGAGDVVIGPNQELYLTVDGIDESKLIIIGNK